MQPARAGSVCRRASHVVGITSTAESGDNKHGGECHRPLMGDLCLGRGTALFLGYIIHLWLFVSLQRVCFTHRYTCSLGHTQAGYFLL